MQFDIPSQTFWGTIGATVLATLGWAWRTERWRGHVMTRAEHERICSEKHRQIQEQLWRIETLIESGANDTHEYRERTGNVLHGMAMKIAVIQTQLMGIPPPFGEP